LSSNAQTAEDAMRLNWSPSLGTARNMAIGGAMIGLGGEITSAHINPAGLGLYKNGDIVLSSGVASGRLNAEYRDIKNQKGESVTKFNLGTSGIILAGNTGGWSRRKSNAIALTVNQIASFKSNINYKGFNNASSGAERYAEELVASRLTLDDAINSRFVSLPTRMAIFGYLVDTMTLGGVKQVVAMPEFTNGVNQTMNIQQRGGSTEAALSIAVNKEDKWFLGGSFGVPIMNYSKTTQYSEADASTITNNRFKEYTYTEDLNTTGVGFNAKFGIIYRPVERFRIGATVHTPTFYYLKDEMNGSLFANTENYNGSVTVKTRDITGGEDNIVNNYIHYTPWKAGIGASYVLNETKNVKKQRAFIAADVEYVGNRSMGYTYDEDATQSEFYKATNKNIKSITKNTFNFKVGGEVKFNTIMLRAGAAYFGNPNKEADFLKQDRLNISGGLGYRHKGIFIDATYVHQINNAVDLPYRLADKPNTFANLRGKTGMLMLTFGTKF
jgi:hypothetical protein